MHILIIHAHNEPQSFNAAMKDLAVEELREQGHSVEVSDLYAMSWNPIASAADFGSRVNSEYLTYALEQRHNCSQRTLAPDIQKELDKLLEADLVIFNFPIYWFSMPAIMKGWIDRVLVSGVCYGAKRFYDQGGLVGKKAMLAITVGGQPHMYTGMTVLPTFVAYHVPYISQEARVTQLAMYRQHLRSLDTLQALSFVSLDEFDEKLHPISAPNSKQAPRLPT
jgi:NAD(P)H dehydrogenase (quinone)